MSAAVVAPQERQRPTTVTKDDTVALWYAVEAFHEQQRAMRSMGFSPEVVQHERQRVLAARCALRKINALRKGGTRG